MNVAGGTFDSRLLASIVAPLHALHQAYNHTHGLAKQQRARSDQTFAVALKALSAASLGISPAACIKVRSAVNIVHRGSADIVNGWDVSIRTVPGPAVSAPGVLAPVVSGPAVVGPSVSAPAVLAKVIGLARVYYTIEPGIFIQSVIRPLT
jgi:hypothetical protein